MTSVTCATNSPGQETLSCPSLDLPRFIAFQPAVTRLCLWHHHPPVFVAPSRYGNLVLAVEVISSTATFGYAILLIKQSSPKPSLGLPMADPDAELPPDDALMFNLRVLIPCYKEKVCVCVCVCVCLCLNDCHGTLKRLISLGQQLRRLVRVVIPLCVVSACPSPPSPHC